MMKRFKFLLIWSLAIISSLTATDATEFIEDKQQQATLKFTSLGTLNGGNQSYATGINYDGTVVIGYAADGHANNEKRAFRWTEGEGMQSLGTLNGGNESSATAVNLWGNVIVGYANDGKANNKKELFDGLRKKGCNLSGR